MRITFEWLDDEIGMVKFTVMKICDINQSVLTSKIDYPNKRVMEFNILANEVYRKCLEAD